MQIIRNKSGGEKNYLNSKNAYNEVNNKKQLYKVPERTLCVREDTFKAVSVLDTH